MLKFDPEAFTTQSALPLFREEHDAYRTAARDFVAGEIATKVEEWEVERDYPRGLFRATAEAGHFAAQFDPRWGGAGPDLLASAVFIEELSRCGSAGLAADIRAHAHFACGYLDRNGSDDQRKLYLAPSISGDLIGAVEVVALDEAGRIGDPRIHAVREGDDWVLNGAGALVLNGSWADYSVVVAQSEISGESPEVGLFILDMATDGVGTNRHLRGGWRTSHTAELSCVDVRVPDRNRLPVDGVTAIAQHLLWEQLVLSLSAVATAEVSLDQAISYASEREAFGRPISSFQVWQHRFADLGTEIELSRSLAHHALRLYVAAEEGDDVPPSELSRATGMAKLYTERVAQRTADECVQVHGGAGYLMEYPAQRYWRDTRLGVPGGGTAGTLLDIVATSYGL